MRKIVLLLLGALVFANVGLAYQRMYQGVAPNNAGDLVIPERIDGLPVRKIMLAAL